MLTYTTAQSTDLPQIITLQKANLKENLSPEEVKSQGYVTVVHDEDLLADMNHPYPHIIAKKEDQVIAYALVMTLEIRDRIPILVDMIAEIDRTEYKGALMEGRNYVIVGQICVAKEYRGQGIFRKLYEYYREVMSPHFDYIVTGIATSNTRSMKAHEKIGFKILSIFEDEDGEWANVIWDVSSKKLIL